MHNVTVTNQPLAGNGIRDIYTIVDADGNPVSSFLSGPTITASGTWSNTATVSGSQVVIGKSTFTLPVTQFGVGTGTVGTYSFTGTAGKTLTNVQVWVNDWRGNNLQSKIPITNQCVWSQDFNQASWALTGVTAIPSAWKNVTKNTANAYRASAHTDIGGMTNSAYVYDAGSNLYVKTRFSTYAACTKPGGAEGGVILSGFGTAASVTGELVIVLDSNSLANAGVVQVWFNMDGLSWQLAFQSGPPGTSNYSEAFSSKPIIISANPIDPTLPLTIADMSKLQVQVTANRSGYTSDPVAHFNLYDVVFLEKSIIYDSTIVNAPDSTNTGTVLQESRTAGQHYMSTTFVPTSAGPQTSSCYVKQEDVHRQFGLAIQDKTCTFLGSISGTTLTVGSISQGTPEVGMILTGPQVPDYCWIVSGSGATWTINSPGPYATSPALTNITISGHTNAAYATFNLATLAKNVFCGSADIELVSAGVYRISVTGPVSDTNSKTASFGLYPLESSYPVAGGSPTPVYGGYDQYVGDGSGSVGVWGVQIQSGSSSTPYLVTVSEAVSDSITIDYSTNTVAFGVNPITDAILTFSGDVYAASPGVVEYYATFTYSAEDPVYEYIGADPAINLSISTDGGHTWGPDRPTSIGKQGDYTRRAIWRRLGMFRDAVLRLTCSEPVKVSLIGSDLQVKDGEVNK